MSRLVVTLIALAAVAAGQSSSDEQRRAMEEYQRILQAQRQFGDLNGFGSPRLCSACGPGYVEKLSAKSRASFVSVTMLAAPKKARSNFLKAERALLQKPQRIDNAQQALREATSLYPKYAAAWSLLGKVELATGNREAALHSFLKAVEADAAFLDPHADLARLHLEDGDWKALEESARRIVRVNPHFTLGHLYLGVAFFNQGALDGAERHAQQALATEDVKLFPETHHLLGQIYERRGDGLRASEHFRIYVAEANPPEPWLSALREKIHALETR